VNNSGALFDPIGSLAIHNGNYTQSVSGTLQIDIGGLTANTQHDVFGVAGSASLNGRLILRPSNGFLPASGDVFRVMTYASHSGEFAQVERGLGLAFGPEYQSDGVAVSDSPTLVEFSQRPDKRVSQQNESNGFTLRVINPTTQTITAALNDDLPTGFRYLSGTLSSNLAIGEPITAIVNDVQSLVWSQPITLAPMSTFTLHFGVALTTTPNLYTNTATIVVTPTTGSVRQITSRDSVIIYKPASAGTEVVPSRGVAYPPSEPGGSWRLSFKRGTDIHQVSVAITTTPVCALTACGPLAYVAVVHNSQVFTMTETDPGSHRFRVAIPAGRYNNFEPVFIVPVWLTPTLFVNRPANIQAPLDDGDDQCDILNNGAFLTGGRSWCPNGPDIDSAQFFDPSGFVTDANTGRPIAGATVTLYRVPSALPDTRTGTRECRTIDTRPGGLTGTWDLLPTATPNLGLFEDPAFTPAAIDPPLNPQKTDETGRYGWDVIRGCWYVTVEAPGYFTKYSAVVGVPPEVTDLDIALEPWPKVYLPIVLR